jgi:K+-sensing histidine kinase KdpD
VSRAKRQRAGITIRKGEHSFVSISEEDNEQGIAEAHQANIFNMFYRANDRKQGFASIY